MLPAGSITNCLDIYITQEYYFLNDSGRSFGCTSKWKKELLVYKKIGAFQCCGAVRSVTQFWSEPNARQHLCKTFERLTRTHLLIGERWRVIQQSSSWLGWCQKTCGDEALTWRVFIPRTGYGRKPAMCRYRAPKKSIFAHFKERKNTLSGKVVSLLSVSGE